MNIHILIRTGGGGHPYYKDGQYYLANHGTFIRDLTEAEYYKLRLLITRQFSGYWVFFAFISFNIGMSMIKRSKENDT